MDSRDTVIHFHKNFGVFAANARGKQLCESHTANELCLRMTFHSRFDYYLDFAKLRTLNKKSRWFKIYGRNPLCSKLADKIEVKSWVARSIGWEYVASTLGVWDSFEDIDVDAPPVHFVLKHTNDSGKFSICRSRYAFNVAATHRSIKYLFFHDCCWTGYEWPYGGDALRIIGEEFYNPPPRGRMGPS